MWSFRMPRRVKRCAHAPEMSFIGRKAQNVGSSRRAILRTKQHGRRLYHQTTGLAYRQAYALTLTEVLRCFKYIVFKPWHGRISHHLLPVRPYQRTRLGRCKINADGDRFCVSTSKGLACGTSLHIPAVWYILTDVLTPPLTLTRSRWMSC